MKHGSLNPYQAIQAFVATLNPNLRPFLERVKDHNRADALLIAHAGRRTL